MIMNIITAIVILAIGSMYLIKALTYKPASGEEPKSQWTNYVSFGLYIIFAALYVVSGISFKSSDDAYGY